jgi:hypothetical protein
MFSFPFYALIWQGLTSCGPEDCSGLTIDVNDILENQEAQWLQRRDDRRACENICEDEEDDCIDLANGNVTPDPMDTAQPELPTIDECADDLKDCEQACPNEQDLAKTFEYGSNDYPLISWTGGPVAGLSVRINHEKGPDDFYWSINCSDESNCLESPVSFKPLNANDTINASELEEREPFLSLNDRVVYTLSTGRSTGDASACVIPKNLELPFEYLQGKRYQFD